MSMRLGICLDGVEEQFERKLVQMADGSGRYSQFHYCEIGTAGCETFLGVHNVLSKVTNNFYMIGIDPSQEAKEAYERKITDKSHSTFINMTRAQAFYSCPNYIGDTLDFVFIDGCHSKCCVMCDFLEISPIVTRFGLMVFHDIESVEGETQPHCNAPRGVREALEELGLWQNARCSWKRLPDWQCDKTKNAFSCACFEKV